MKNAHGTAVAGVVGAAILAACLLEPGLRAGVASFWVGAAVIVVPTAALLTATGSRYYGFGRSLAVGLAVTLAAGGVSWVVAIFTLVKALSGRGVLLVWAILPFAASVVAVLALGVLALRVVPPRSAREG